MDLRVEYTDGKVFTLSVKQQNAAKLFECLKKKSAFVDTKSGRGIWLDLDKVRHIIIEGYNDAEELEPGSACDENCQANEEDSGQPREDQSRRASDRVPEHDPSPTPGGG